MRVGPLLFRVTGAAVFLQLLLGGLLTFGFIDPLPHIVVGFLVLFLAIVLMVVSLVSKPSFRPMKMLSLALVALILVQIVLGFATLGTGGQLIAWIHFVNAMAIFGAAVSGTFMAFRWDHMARAGSIHDTVGDRKPLS